MDSFNKLILVLFLIILIPLLIFGIPWIITKVLIWGINGIWNYDLTDKFWYMYWIIFVLGMLFKGNTGINTGK